VPLRNGRRVDRLVYSILRREWERRVAPLMTLEQ
jgi:RimJ/RimL family protein N-acetyltransferase